MGPAEVIQTERGFKAAKEVWVLPQTMLNTKMYVLQDCTLSTTSTPVSMLLSPQWLVLPGLWPYLTRFSHIIQC